ncbi:MAG TPA: hypothetical protein VK506_05100 [Conexibacter sp.]|nr:hypothetical protein [Conexibacter sp.]
MERVRALAVPLGVALALALALVACGGDEERESAAPLTQPPATTQATAPAPTTTAATTVATTGTTTVPPATTTAPTTPATTPAPSGGAPATTPADSGGAPAGCPGAVGGFIRDVRASGTDCGVAGEVASAWFDAIDAGAAPDAPITAAGFACSGTLAGQITSVSCSGKGGSVSFTASP